VLLNKLLSVLPDQTSVKAVMPASGWVRAVRLVFHVADTCASRQHLAAADCCAGRRADIQVAVRTVEVVSNGAGALDWSQFPLGLRTGARAATIEHFQDRCRRSRRLGGEYHAYVANSCLRQEFARF
jgi:hypothetical protein